jgi:hypothetical protein
VPLSVRAIAAVPIVVDEGAWQAQQHPRFLIANPNHKIGLARNGMKRKATCSAPSTTPFKNFCRLSTAQNPCAHIVAPIYVEVYSETDLILDQISDWLVKVARLTIDAESHGNGPVEGSLGLIRINWGKIRETTTEN